MINPFFSTGLPFKTRLRKILFATAVQTRFLPLWCYFVLLTQNNIWKHGYRPCYICSLFLLVLKIQAFSKVIFFKFSCTWAYFIMLFITDMLFSLSMSQRKIMPNNQIHSLYTMGYSPRNMWILYLYSQEEWGHRSSTK